MLLAISWYNVHLYKYHVRVEVVRKELVKGYKMRNIHHLSVFKQFTVLNQAKSFGNVNQTGKYFFKNVVTDFSNNMDM